MLGANTLGNKLTDIAVELVPEHIDRGTVRPLTDTCALPCSTILTICIMCESTCAGGVCCQDRPGIVGCCYRQELAWGRYLLQAVYHKA